MAPRVTVVGGGPAGALTAIALCRYGVPTAVYEAYADPAGTTGSFLSLGANGLRTLRAVGCAEPVLARGFTVSSLYLWANHGRLLGVVSDDRGSREPFTSLVIRRNDFVDALRTEALQAGASIHTGKWLVDASPAARGVTARFADGISVESDVLIGADGANSRIRRVIDAAASVPEGISGYAVDGIATLPGVSPGALHVVLARRSCLVYSASPAGTIWWSATLPADAPMPADAPGPTEEDCRLRLAELYDHGHAVAGALVRATEALGRPVPLPRPYNVTRWRRGRMVIIGDAAHPIGYGLGASLAMEDGLTLARCLRDPGDVSAMLATYEALRRPRIDRVARVTDLWDADRLGPVGYWMAGVVAPFLLRHFWDRSTSWLLGWDTGCALPLA